MNNAYEVVVVGGGPAGLTGAIALARSLRRVLVIDSGESRNLASDQVHNLLGSEGIPPQELYARARSDLARYGGEVLDATVDGIETADLGGLPGFQVSVSGGARTTCRRLLVATGLVDELPDLPGLRERWGKDVLHCPYCHGYEVRGRAIGVLSVSPFSFHQTLLFRQLSPDVVVFEHTGPTLSPAQRRQLHALDIEVVRGAVRGLELDEGGVGGVRLENGDVVSREVVAVSPRLRSRSEVVERLGLRAEPVVAGDAELGSALRGDITGRTTVPGVWVAGNVVGLQAQVVTAAAAGLFAASAINNDLVEEDARAALGLLDRREGRTAPVPRVPPSGSGPSSR